MAKFKDFGSGVNSTVSDPISFKLHGEEFHCVTALQGKTLLGFVADSNSNDPVKQAQTIEKFFDYVLVDESAERFNALQATKDKIVSVETLGDIIGWVVGQYTDRPEEQPEV
jgi:hypothetical protein